MNRIGQITQEEYDLLTSPSFPKGRGSTIPDGGKSKYIFIKTFVLNANKPQCECKQIVFASDSRFSLCCEMVAMYNVEKILFQVQ